MDSSETDVKPTLEISSSRQLLSWLVEQQMLATNRNIRFCSK